jgi:hypothetical protein
LQAQESVISLLAMNRAELKQQQEWRQKCKKHLADGLSLRYK